MDLGEFLLARIAEDEAVALEAAWRSSEWQATTEPVAEHIARWDPPRVLAECDAKRRIVEAHRTVSMNWHTCVVCDYLGYDGYGEGDRWGCDTLRLLALPYASHPDFQPEWSALADA